MAAGHLNRILHHLRAAALVPEDAARTDGELLGAFLAQRDEDAFAALMQRHAPMVLGVCRRLLPNAQDAEDAFQATFLVLARKAGSVVPREQVGNWLYGVAYRTALEARRAVSKRSAKEKQLLAVPHPPARPERGVPELNEILDEELSRLSDKHRLPLVLCDLEGRTRREVAQQLHLADGTLSRRLTAARRLLAQRLSRRGLTLSGGGLATILAEEAAQAAVPAALTLSTLQAASLVAAGQTLATGAVSASVSLLIEGVLKTMFLAKLKTALAVLVLVTLLSLGGVWCLSSTAAQQPDQKTPVAQGKAQQPEQSKPEVKKEPNKAADDLKIRIKKMEDEVYKLRAAMLKECDDETKKLDEAIKKVQDKGPKKLEAKNFADFTKTQAEVRALQAAKRQVSMVKLDIERRIHNKPEPFVAPPPPLDAKLGISTSTVSDVLALQLGLKDRGLVVDTVKPKTGAEKAGLKKYDILVEIDGKVVPSSSSDLRKLLGTLNLDAGVNAVIIRGGKQETIKGLGFLAPAKAAPTEPKKPATEQPKTLPGEPKTPPGASGIPTPPPVTPPETKKTEIKPATPNNP